MTKKRTTKKHNTIKNINTMKIIVFYLNTEQDRDNNIFAVISTEAKISEFETSVTKELANHLKEQYDTELSKQELPKVAREVVFKESSVVNGNIYLGSTTVDLLDEIGRAHV